MPNTPDSPFNTIGQILHGSPGAAQSAGATASSKVWFSVECEFEPPGADYGDIMAFWGPGAYFVEPLDNEGHFRHEYYRVLKNRMIAMNRPPWGAGFIQQVCVEMFTMDHQKLGDPIKQLRELWFLHERLCLYFAPHNHGPDLMVPALQPGQGSGENTHLMWVVREFISAMNHDLLRAWKPFTRARAEFNVDSAKTLYADLGLFLLHLGLSDRKDLILMEARSAACWDQRPTIPSEQFGEPFRGENERKLSGYVTDSERQKLRALDRKVLRQEEDAEAQPRKDAEAQAREDAEFRALIRIEELYEEES